MTESCFHSLLIFLIESPEGEGIVTAVAGRGPFQQEM